MLRGLTRSGVPVTGAQFIDILKQRSLVRFEECER